MLISRVATGKMPMLGTRSQAHKSSETQWVTYTQKVGGELQQVWEEGD